MHSKIDPKLQKMSKIQVVRMILYEGVRKSTQGGFAKFQRNFIGSILIREILRKGWMELDMKEGRIKRKGT